jgi:hypothetical protein
MGGEEREGSLNRFSGYSDTAQRTEKPAYLEPIRQSMHVPIEGVCTAAAKKIEDRVAIGQKHNQNHAENPARAYLERIRNTMHEPIEGRSKITHTNPARITKTLIPLGRNTYISDERF